MRFCKICVGILIVFATPIALFLAFYSLRYSYYSSTNYKLAPYIIADHPIWNLCAFAGMILLSFILMRFLETSKKKRRLAGYLYLAGWCLIYGVMGFIWVSGVPYYPDGDQLIATAAAYYHRLGNFSMLGATGYLGKFPYQKGLAFLYEILFDLFGDFCYPVAAKIHVILGMITMIFGYLIVEETSSHRICKLLYCPLAAFCIPYLFLTPYTYGDLPSICFCTILFWALIRFSRTLKWRYVFVASCVSALSLMVRMHTWIIFIAAGIGMFLVSVQKKKIRPVLSVAVLTVCAVLSVKAVDYSYYLRSGYEITKGAPMILTVAMGLGDNYGGPGIYNNYQTDTMTSVNYDPVAASEIGKKEVQDRLDAFKQDPAYAKWFFKTKLQWQWIEPTFETLISTHSFDEERLGSTPDWVFRIYEGDLHDSFTGFANRYQSIVYLGFLCYLPVLWKKRDSSPVAFIPLIAIVGGFLFSIIWESQCRYVLPYYLFMLLYVPEGIRFVCDLLRSCFQRIRSFSYSKPIRNPNRL